MRGVEYGSGAINNRPYICLQDLELTLSRAAPELPKDTIKAFESELYELEREFSPVDESNVVSVDAGALLGELETRAEEVRADSDGRVGIIYMDADLGRDDTQGARLELSRSLNNDVIKRIGAVDEPDVQFAKVESWIKDNQFEELLLVDDVLAFGDTLSEVATRIHKLSPELARVSFSILAGITSTGGVWRGLERATELGFNVEYIQKAHAGGEIEGVTKGLAIPTSRDLTLFGGKAGVETIADLPATHPYMWPFSTPAASIIDTTRVAEASSALLDFNQRLVEAIDTAQDKDLTLRELTARGFGIPHISVPSDEVLAHVEAKPDATLADYLSTVRSATNF